MITPNGRFKFSTYERARLGQELSSRIESFSSERNFTTGRMEQFTKFQGNLHELLNLIVETVENA